MSSDWSSYRLAASVDCVPDTYDFLLCGQGSLLSDSQLRDADLAARVSHGDETALETLFAEFRGPVKAVARRVVRDETLAEDVTQDTFVRFWNAPEKYDPRLGTLNTFLTTIAHRRGVDVVRSEAARTRREMRPPDQNHYNVEDEVWTRDISSKVRDAIAQLPEKEREAVALAHLGGLTYVEVAREIGAPEGTVKTRIRSGMKKLAVLLAESTR